MPCFGLAEGEANENNIDAICPCYLVVAELLQFYFSSAFFKEEL